MGNIWKPTFLNQSRPMVTGMVLKDNPDEIRYTVKNSIYAGADAVGIQLCRIKREYKTEENYRSMFAAAAGRPVYVTNYRYAQNTGMTDEECMEELLTALRCGATLADVMGDTFSQADMELTTDENAIRKQMELIDEIHAMGKEAVMSSHVYRFIPAETVVEIALEQQRRGADIAKIVTGSNSDEELIENLRITTLLKKELEIPFLFLSGGSHSKLHRMVGPQLGCCTYLAVYEHDKDAVTTQPTIAAAKAVRDHLDYMPDIVY